MSLLVDEQREFVGEKLECRGAGDQATVSGGKLTMPCGRVEAGLPRDDLVVSGKDAHKRHLVREGTPQIIAQRATTLAPQAASPKQARDAQGSPHPESEHLDQHDRVDTEQPIQRAAQRDETSEQLRSADGDRTRELTTTAVRNDRSSLASGVNMAGQGLFDGDRGALPARDAALRRCEQGAATQAV
jgi:hypothetical protein